VVDHPESVVSWVEEQVSGVAVIEGVTGHAPDTKPVTPVTVTGHAPDTAKRVKGEGEGEGKGKEERTANAVQRERAQDADQPSADDAPRPPASKPRVDALNHIFHKQIVYAQLDWCNATFC